MKHIIFIHGACHGAWSWYKVSAMLRSAGYRVSTPDLAASGIDERKLDEVVTFAQYSQPLLDILGSLPAGERVILVGHSLGGMNMALAMEMFPEKVAVAVFVTGSMPDFTSPPSSVLDKFSILHPASFWMDTQFTSYSDEERRPSSVFFGPNFMQSKLYNLCSPEDVTLARVLVRVGSLFHEDLRLQPPFSKGRYGSVAAVYVVCGQDLAVTADYQRWMIANNPVKEVKTIQSADHMAMLSAPEELCQYLQDVANRYA
ncbi:salicylic acid-binding protein 2-like [Typha angustifolia]|uniref:salicylic acid-binding protein 2-like n=1 Tax=Typha angustifolia TaxID=59011 RepID=UPI003C2D0DB3